MTRKITKSVVPIGILGLVGMLVVYSVSLAASSATVTATVTVQNISLSVSDGAVAYGTLASNTSKSTCTSELNDGQTVTNNGNVAETFRIKGVDTTNWTLASTTASDQYVHQFKNGTCSTFSSGTALTTSDQDLATNIGASATTTLNLQIITPNPSTVFTQQSPNVTLTAVAF